MKNTKQKICNTARKLFNEMGYSQVTIRMIAAELKISSGNLNYHFRKREDILEALYFEMVEVFDARVKELESQVISLEYIQSSVEASMDRMIEYGFFWTDLYFLLKSNKKIKNHFEQAKMERINGYQLLFKLLIKKGILSSPSFPNEHSLLIERMIDYSNTWLYASALYEVQESNQEMINNASFHLLSMLYPYLTHLGQENFKKIYAHKMNE